MNEGFHPLVSVITCFLNVEKFITEMIESVLAQDYPNWELILIDDGSTDTSTQIAKQYANNYPYKIFYHEHAGHLNKGASESRNVALMHAKGEYITFLDGDDVWLPPYLSTQLAIAKDNPEAGLICEATEYWYDWAEQGAKNILTPVGVLQNQLYYPPELSITLYPLGYKASPCICAMLLKKTVIEKYGTFEASFKGMYDDQVLLTKIFLQEPVYISSVCHNRYRQRPGSLVHSTKSYSRYSQVRKKFFKWLENYLHEEQLHYPEVEQLLIANLNYRRPFWLLIKDFFWHLKKKIHLN